MQDLDKILNVAPSAADSKSLVVIKDEEEKDVSAETDVEDARDNLQNAVELSQQAVQDMLNIAQQSQHPKAYEVLNSMIKTYADISMGMVDLQLKKQRLNGTSKNGGQEEQGQTINNLFVGSTAELQKMIEDMKNKE